MSKPKKPKTTTKVTRRVVGTVTTTPKTKEEAKAEKDARSKLIFDLACRITSASDLSIMDHDLDTLDDVTLEAIGKALGSTALDAALAEIERGKTDRGAKDVKRALASLTDAADTYMTSDPQMPSHAETERDLERAIEAARTILSRKDD